MRSDCEFGDMKGVLFSYSNIGSNDTLVLLILYWGGGGTKNNRNLVLLYKVVTISEN